MIAPQNDLLTITIGGRALSTWQEVRVTRGVERLPSDSAVKYTEGQNAQPFPWVAEGSPCTIDFSGDLVLTGYADRWMPHYDKSDHSVQVLCRSKTEDLVDCTPDTDAIGAYAISSGTIGQAATKLCAPYGIQVMLPDGDAALPVGSYFDMHPGYTVYFLLEEMARSVGMLVWDDQYGNLVLSRGGTGGRAATSLVEGQNVEVVDVVHGMDGRYSEYRVLSQAAVNAHPGFFNIAGQAFDTGVPRRRLLTIPAEVPDPGQTQSALRAQWEANRRYGRSQLVRVAVTTLRDGADNLWWPNTMVACVLPTASVNADRCISEVSYVRSANGTQAILSLMPVQGLAVQPLAITPPIFNPSA